MNKTIAVFLLLYICVVNASAQKIKRYDAIVNKDSIAPVGIIKNISDSTLLDIVQRQTFRYFWHYAHPVSGLARERDNTVRGDYYWDYINEAYDEPNFSKHTYGPEACAIGGTGFGILSTIVAVNRGWIGKDTALKRLVKMADFLNTADSYHGIFPHFMNGATGKTIAFGKLDDGADIVETSYLLWVCYVPKNILMAIHRLKNISVTALHKCGMPPTLTGIQTAETLSCTGIGAR